MEIPPDFSEFIASLAARDARFIVVGGYAVAFHGHPRYTGDIDIWLAADEENARSVMDALEEFGFGDLGLTIDDFLEPDRVVQLGYPPMRIDLMTGLDGVTFDEAYEHRVEVELRAVRVPFLSLEDLRRNKRATARAQDLADLEALDGER